jgi:hypothetical protein
MSTPPPDGPGPTGRGDTDTGTTGGADPGPRTGEPLPSAPLPPPPPPPGLAGAPRPPGPPPPTGGLPSQRPFDVVAIFAMVFAVLFGPVGLVLAIVSMFRTGSARRGRALAVTALIVSVLWIAGVVASGLALYNLVARRDDSGAINHAGKLPVNSLRAGDCVKKFGEGSSITVDGVPCSDPHNTQVYAIFELPDEPFPGQDGVISASEKGCTDRVPAALEPRVSNGDLSVAYLHPQEASWDRGDREVACVVISEKGDLTESLPVTG